jgi:hypothetical protein
MAGFKYMFIAIKKINEPRIKPEMLLLPALGPVLRECAQKVCLAHPNRLPSMGTKC